MPSLLYSDQHYEIEISVSGQVYYRYKESLVSYFL